MATVNEQLQHHAIDHLIDLGRYSNGVIRRMIALLNRVDPDLMAKIAEAIERLGPESATVGYLETVLASAREINARAYQAVFGALPDELRALADYEAGYQLDLFGHVLPRPVLVRFPLSRVAPAQVYAAAMSRPFQGGLLREWAASTEANRMKAIRDAIRIGFVEGQTNEQIVTRIRGTRALRYKDGVLERSRRGLTAIVRTAVGHTAATARDQTYAANADVIKAEEWVATLDLRTSPMCRARDGKRYTAGEHKPIGHSIPWGAGPGRLHFACRSTSAPVTKSWRELGLDIDELDPATRASMDGQVPAGTTYPEWLAKQSAARQDEVLGPTRGKLLREGGLSIEAMYSQRGDFLTLEQLRRKDASAFGKAGLQQAA